jgi:hypothetical protein
VAAFGPRMRDTRCGMLGDDVQQIEISDLQNREGQHPLSRRSSSRVLKRLADCLAP